MAPPQGLSSPLSSLSPLSSRSPRSPSPRAARSPPLRIDDIAEHSPNAPLDCPTSTKQHSPPAAHPGHAGLEGARGRLVEPVKAGDEREDEDVDMSQGGAEGMDFGLSRSHTGENGGERATGEVVQELEDVVRVEVDEVELLSPNARSVSNRRRLSSPSAHSVAATPSPFPEPAPPPPLTPRSQRTFDNFDMRSVAFPQSAPPPPDRVVYQYFVPLPYPNSGGHLVGPGGRVAVDIRMRSGVANFLVLIREDELAYIVMSGTRRAIQRALEICKDIERSSTVHSRRGPWQRAQLQAAGSAWCEYDEANLERVPGFWLRDRFTDEAVDDGPHGGAWRADDLHGRRWGHEKAQGDGAAAHERHWGSGAQSAPATAQRDRRLPPPPPPAPDVRSAARLEREQHGDRSRAEPSRSSARRRSASPPRRSERSARSPSRSHGDPRPTPAPHVVEPRWVHPPRTSASGRSHHRHEPSTAALDTVAQTKFPPSSLGISIPMSAIERFVGPNAAGHFIAQTTGVRLVVEAALEGATLRLELGAGATSDSLVEARALVDKVLERSGLAVPPPPGASSVDAPRRTRDESQQRGERASGAHERGGGRDHHAHSRARDGERVRDEEGRDEGWARRDSGHGEASGNGKGRASRRRNERSYSPERHRHHSSGSTRRSLPRHDDDRSTRPPSPSSSTRTMPQHYLRQPSKTGNSHQARYPSSYGTSHTPYSTSRDDQYGSSSSARRPQPAVREWDLLAERDRDSRAHESGFSRSGWERETGTLLGSPCPTEKSGASGEVDGSQGAEVTGGLEGRLAGHWTAVSSWLYRRRNTLWAGRLALLLLVVAVYYTTFHGASQPYACPDPFLERASAPTHKSRSSALTIPTLSPSFTLTLAHDLSTCNAFEVVISRTDTERCARTEYEVEPSLDEELNSWIKSQLGPDTFTVQIEGAERQLLDVPTEYLGNCSYAYRFNLVNAGKVWVTVELLHEDYEGFKEPREVLTSRPAPLLVRQPLLDGPLELDLCPSSCTPYAPPGDLRNQLVVRPSSFHISPRTNNALEPPPVELPSCGSSSSFGGAYLPLASFALAHPSTRLPESTSTTAERRSSAGLYSYHRTSCSMDHAGVRFADHAPCLASGHKALFLGDSHARVAYDVVKWRMEGHDDFALESPKELLKNTTVGDLGLYFKWDSYFDEKLDCDYLDQFDSITLSTGSHPACFKCPPTSQWTKHVEERLHELANLLRICPTRKPRSLLLFTLPTFPPEIGRNDCRTGPRMHRWNEELRRIAQEQGDWQVVDVERYSRPVQDDMRLFDGTHFLRTDAIDPVVDEIIARLGFCTRSPSVDELIA